MKKLTILIMSTSLSVLLISCEKGSSDIVSSSSTSVGSASSGGGSTGSGGSGGLGTSGSGGSGGGVITGSGFSANFNIDVNDINNVLENNNIRLTSKGTGIVSYYWRFGDGRTSTERNPVISYQMHGNYNISLRVADSNGKTETEVKEIGILCNFIGGTGGSH
jgi:PKD repeat protein